MPQKEIKISVNSPEFQKMMKELKNWQNQGGRRPFHAVLKESTKNKPKLEILGIDITRLTESEWKLMKIENFPSLMTKVRIKPREITGVQYRALIDKKNPYATVNFMFLELEKPHHPYNWKRPENLSHISQIKRAEVAATAVGIKDARKFLSRIKLAKKNTRESAGKTLTGREMSWVEKVLPELADWVKKP
ncbi:unnamed protein product [marine sediment metagenome]|uniref:Uncharacterized protein n=1 Tax=marine sediment metagenome TaxID=412755 RepID=X0YEE9_9ZZZZ